MNTVYLRYYGNLNNVDISGYDTISEINASEDVDIKNSLINVITGESKDKNEAKIKVDLSEITDWAIANYNKHNSDDFTMVGREIFKIDDKRDLYITSFYVEFYQESKEISDLSVSGYVLEHN